jgi:hypothetical protein
VLRPRGYQRIWYRKCLIDLCLLIIVSNICNKSNTNQIVCCIISFSFWHERGLVILILFLGWWLIDVLIIKQLNKIRFNTFFKTMLNWIIYKSRRERKKHSSTPAFVPKHTPTNWFEATHACKIWASKYLYWSRRKPNLVLVCPYFYRVVFCLKP